MKPALSIITPTYNHGPFIAECVESILAQPYGDWEALIMDDGSTDGTRDAVARFDDPRIRYFGREHRGIWGLGETYNVALREARGDFIAILEGDDRWYQRRLAEHLAAFRDPAVVMVYGCAEQVRPDGYIEGESPAPDLQRELDPPGQPWGREFVRQMLLRPYSFVPTMATLIRKDALLAIGGFWQPPYFPAVDYGTFLRLGLRGRVVYMPGVVAMWRRHGSQVTNRMSMQIAAGALQNAEDFLAELSDQERQQLGVTAGELRRRRRPWLGDLYWAEALAAYRSGSPEAAQSVAAAVRYGRPMRKAEALAALALARCGVNPAAFIDCGAALPVGRWLAGRMSGAGRPAPASAARKRE